VRCVSMCSYSALHVAGRVRSEEELVRKKTEGFSYPPRPALEGARSNVYSALCAVNCRATCEDRCGRKKVVIVSWMRPSTNSVSDAGGARSRRAEAENCGTGQAELNRHAPLLTLQRARSFSALMIIARSVTDHLPVLVTARSSSVHGTARNGVYDIGWSIGRCVDCRLVLLSTS
jgi:hypothetical protein